MQKNTNTSWTAKPGKMWHPDYPEREETVLGVFGGEPQDGFEGNMICSVSPMSHVTAKDVEHANLIAAAPDLLAACEHALGTMEHYWPLLKDREDFQPQLRAAIAKAKGEDK